MLNRRTIRIKVMQSLFAYSLCEEAHYHLALEFVASKFAPDLNSMEVQDKEALLKKKELASRQFEQLFLKEGISDPDPEISKVVDQALRMHQEQVKKEQQLCAANLLSAIEHIMTLYHRILHLLIAFKMTAATDKRNGHKNLVKNRLIHALENNEEVKKTFGKYDWQNQMSNVRSWFKELREDEVYQRYSDLKEPDETADLLVVKHISKKTILSKGPIFSFLEEMDLHWAEDCVILRSLADKTFRSYGEGAIHLQKLSIDWEDDKKFIEKLFGAVLSMPEKFQELISKNTRNWDVDRLPLTDRVILEMSIAEMITFPSIPVKVSINEYIELAKEYSTPNSRQFINGILDTIAGNMLESGDIKKSGKGLIDNK